ncbi:MAG: hypothetical protein ABWY56_15125 [Propionibacteriaceae bacterium]
MSEHPPRSGQPRFTGVTTYTDALGRYEFRHPSDWFRADLDDGVDGVMVGPEPEDEATHFAVAVTDLGVGVVADDLDVLRAGFDDGLAALPDLQVESLRDDTYNDIVKLERTITFTDGNVTRKRRVWSLYADHWQFTVVYQGSSVAEFDYWLPMANYCFTAFQLPLALWFATDPVVSR